MSLRFREPVALVKLAGGGQHLVDREGTVLSVEDVELDAFEPLATVSGQGLTAPSDARSGIVWKSRSSTGPDEVDERIVAAARLARFLKQEFNRQRCGFFERAADDPISSRRTSADGACSC